MNGINQYKIVLRPDEVQEFVNEASRYDFDNSYVVDAKSILGVYGLDLTRVLTVSCHGYDKKFENYLRKFAMAG